MKKIYYSLIVFGALCVAGCSDSLSDATSAITTPNEELPISPDAAKGELLIKFNPEVLPVLDKAEANAKTRAGGKGIMTRSSLPSVDKVLALLGTYHFQRVFPVDSRHEERTRKTGLNLWYLVKFDESKDLKQAAKELGDLGEINTVEFNSSIKRAYSPKIRPVMVSPRATRSIARGLEGFNDPQAAVQWNYVNQGPNSIPVPADEAGTDGTGFVGHMTAGCDVNCKDAWQMSTGDPSVIVAVMDEGVMYTHEDLKDNMWTNEAEDVTSDEDKDGNGYAGDRHGFNFVNNTGYISWSDKSDTGHGTHVAGSIAAVNNNGKGVCGIAGGNGTAGSGVKIMSLQIFSGDKGASLYDEARAMKYAADNGAVVLQCSWGYNSGLSNAINGYTPGPSSDKEWTTSYPLEKEALDYFVHNAGSPNGVMEGGIVVYAAGNESAAMAGYPGAYPDYVSVAATAADYTPATYTNYGTGVNISAPGGDSYYHCATEGQILSTVPGTDRSESAYGYMEGTSMACPQVSGVVALGLSYAAKLHKHFTWTQVKDMLINSARSMEKYYPNKKVYYQHWTIAGMNVPMQMDLANYTGKMGGGMVDAGAFLRAIKGSSEGVPMKVPNVYVAEGKESKVNLAIYFDNAAKLAITCTPADNSIATATVDKAVLTVKGLKAGVTKATVTVSGGQKQDIVITVRKGAGNGWM